MGQLSVAHDLDDKSSHWFGRIWIPYYQDVIWHVRWLPLTHTIYHCGNKPWVPLTGPWGVTSYAPALLRRQMSVPTSDTTPGYPFWQANRGKRFKAPVVTGPEIPIHMFDDSIDYKAEMEYKYEDVFRRKNEARKLEEQKGRKLEHSARAPRPRRELTPRRPEQQPLSSSATPRRGHSRLGVPSPPQGQVTHA
ncbi:hypothetical protein PIB30_086205 [Stylosanthes scabra]|uniref:DUF7745 domain-containing protein n=1 Tax=Stylosanthes scabra TaxID=79078 RepID=A0ABU6SU05_9FABA|nr:hypothetical protein [Stylosanthes scabra]